jgi:hypothetical protein
MKYLSRNGHRIVLSKNFAKVSKRHDGGTSPGSGHAAMLLKCTGPDKGSRQKGADVKTKTHTSKQAILQADLLSKSCRRRRRLEPKVGWSHANIKIWLRC